MACGRSDEPHECNGICEQSQLYELNRYVNVCETMMNWNKFYQLMHTLTIFILVPMVTQKVLQYKMYKYMSYELRDRQIDGERMMFKGPDIPEEVKTYQQPFDLDELLDGLTLAKLNRIFKDVMRRQNDKIDPVRSTFGKIEKEEVTVDDKMEYLNEYIRTHHKFSFRNLLMHQKSKLHIVVTFLAVLEMMKVGAITIEQEHTFGEIMITSRQDSQSGERWNTENED